MKNFRVLVVAIFASLIAMFSLVSCNSSSSDVDISLIPVRSGDRWGYINKKGEYIINPQFNDADFFRDGLARIVAPDGKVGYIDKNGKYVLNAKYKYGTYFYEGLAFVVEQGGKPTCIDKKGETKFVLDNVVCVLPFSCGRAAVVNRDGQVGWIDMDGNFAITPQYPLLSFESFCEDLCCICQEESGNESLNFGVIDKTGKIIVNPQFQGLGNFKEGKAWFHNGEQFGYVNTKGEYIINPQFEFCTDFSEGLASFRQGSMYGYIDDKGKIAINPQFDKAGNFKNGYAMVRQGEKWGYIDKDGKIAINPQFDKVSDFFGDIAFVQSANKWGIIDMDGKYIVTPQFDDIKNEIEEFCYVQSDYYDLSAFESKFFDDNATWNYKNFLGITLSDLIENPIYGDDIKTSNDIKKVIWKGEYDIADFKLKKIDFLSDDAFYSYDYYSGRSYNFDTKITNVMYELSFTNAKQKEKYDVIYDKITDYITDKYNLNDTQHGKYWTFSGTTSDGMNIWINVDENNGLTISFSKVEE
ncbi:MAG: WG repeat-containing protein [Bacteroidales bacterium]|nr:WG repeat-containing protein [Bacteroidales bacterium]